VRTTSKIIFAGDPYGDFRAIIKSVLIFKPEAIVILGDFGLCTRLDTELEQIAGPD